MLPRLAGISLSAAAFWPRRGRSCPLRDVFGRPLGPLQVGPSPAPPRDQPNPAASNR